MTGEAASESGPRSRLGGEFLWAITGRLGGAGIQAVSFALAARWSGLELFGTFSQIFGAMMFVQALADCGVLTYVTRLRSTDPHSSQVGGVLHLSELITVGAAIGSAVVIGCVATLDSQYWVVLILGVWMGFDRAVELWLRVDLADGRMKNISWALLARRTGGLVGMVVLQVVCHWSGVASLCVAMTMSSLVCFAVVRPRIAGLVRSERVSKKLAVTSLRGSFGFYMVATAEQMRNLDVIFVGAVGGRASSGLYGAGARVAGPLRLLPDSLAGVILPRIARVRPGTVRGFIGPIGAACAGSFVVAGALFALAPFLVTEVLGDQYVPAIPVIRIFCVAVCFLAMDSQATVFLEGWNQASSAARVSLAATVIYLISIIVGTHLGGAVGAAWGFLASAVIQTAIRLTVLISVKKQLDQAE